jgi:hypothetical protein
MRATSAYSKTVELRKVSRYRLKAPIFFLWAPQNGPVQSGQGVTRDINTCGVYVQANSSPPVGALVQMDIMLPKLANDGLGMHLTGEGIVVRIEPRGTNDESYVQGGFAASVQFYPEASEELVLSHIKTSGRVV